MLALALAAAQPAAAITVETDCGHLAGDADRRHAGRDDRALGTVLDPERQFRAARNRGADDRRRARRRQRVRRHRRRRGSRARSPSEGVDGLTLRNLTFENYEATGARSSRRPKRPLIRSRSSTTPSFTTRAATRGRTGGCSSKCPGPARSPAGGRPVTLADSTFSENTAIDQAGGGAYIDLECHAGSGSASVTNNVFTHNRVASNDRTAPGRRSLVGLGHAIIACPSPHPAGQPVRRERRSKTPAPKDSRRGWRRVHRQRRRDEPRRPLHRQPDRRREVLDRASEGGGFASLDPGNARPAPARARRRRTSSPPATPSALRAVQARAARAPACTWAATRAAAGTT